MRPFLFSGWDFLKKGVEFIKKIRTSVARISPRLFEKPDSQEFPQLQAGAQQTFTMPVVLRGHLQEQGSAQALQNCAEPQARQKGEKQQSCEEEKLLLPDTWKIGRVQKKGAENTPKKTTICGLNEIVSDQHSETAESRPFQYWHFPDCLPVGCRGEHVWSVCGCTARKKLDVKALRSPSKKEKTPSFSSSEEERGCWCSREMGTWLSIHFNELCQQ